MIISCINDGMGNAKLKIQDTFRHLGTTNEVNIVLIIVKRTWKAITHMNGFVTLPFDSLDLVLLMLDNWQILSFALKLPQWINKQATLIDEARVPIAKKSTKPIPSVEFMVHCWISDKDLSLKEK